MYPTPFDVGQQLRVDRVTILGDLTVELGLSREVSKCSKRHIDFNNIVGKIECLYNRMGKKKVIIQKHMLKEETNPY